MAKIAITKDVLDTEEYMDELDLPYQKPEPATPKNSPSAPSTPKNDTPKLSEDGRPPFSKDSTTRKQKRVLPRSSEGTDMLSIASTEMTLWGMEAQDKISKVLTPAMCDHFGKKDARGLSKSEVDNLEYLKLCIFTGMKPLFPVDEQAILDVLKQNTKPSEAFLSHSKQKAAQIESSYSRRLTSSEMKFVYATSYTDLYL
jgi:hypothetical protein